jgi:hypothetical protein
MIWERRSASSVNTSPNFVESASPNFVKGRDYILFQAETLSPRGKKALESTRHLRGSALKSLRAANVIRRPSKEISNRSKECRGGSKDFRDASTFFRDISTLFRDASKLFRGKSKLFRSVANLFNYVPDSLA